MNVDPGDAYAWTFVVFFALCGAFMAWLVGRVMETASAGIPAALLP